MKLKSALTQVLQRAWQKKGVLSTLLLPLSWLVRLEVTRRRKQFRLHPERITHSTKPVIIVGNVFVGGTGKTPVVMALIQALQARGWQPGVISRGYGVKPDARPLAGQGSLDPKKFGDEPALISALTKVPVAVHPKRALALQRLEKAYPQVDVIIADDGLQHLALGRDIEIVVQDDRGVGNGRLLPAGPLREPADRLDTVDFIITTTLTDGERPTGSHQLPGHSSAMTLQPTHLEKLDDGTLLDWGSWLSTHGRSNCTALAGIGNPQRFFTMLKLQGVTLQAPQALPDHYGFETSPFLNLKQQIILITAKDAVKCRRWPDPRVWAVHVQPVFSDPAWLDTCHQMLLRIAERKNTAFKARADQNVRDPASDKQRRR